jgi:hypothetical protein
MKLAFIVLAAGAAAFLLRVLVGLVKELRFPAHAAVKVYHSSFRPRGQQGELIVMQPAVVTRRFTA